MKLPSYARKSFVVVVLLPLLASVSPAQAQLAELRRQFRDGDCDSLVQPLKIHRSELSKSGRISLQVDYMLSVCLCRLPGLNALKKLPSVYRHLTLEDRELISRAVTSCDSGRATAASLPVGGARVEGKGGRSEILSQMSDSWADRYAERVFPLDQEGAALAGLRNAGFENVVARGHFVVTGKVSRQKLESTAKLMDDVLKRFVKRFAFTAPDTLITVYLYADRQDMVQHAEARHGIHIPYELWAYSFPHDSSITVWLSGGMGTVGHEVFHALLDQNAPYAPPWLNEGAAALFEEFRKTSGGKIEGTFRKDHWRVRHIQGGTQVPLGWLLDMTWREFDDASNLDRNHATAKFFAMYLQESKKLKKVLRAYEKIDLFDPRSDAEILQELLGKDIDAVAGDFDEWVMRKVGVAPLTGGK